MHDLEKKTLKKSWFFRWFLNNQAVIALLITFLIFLTIFMFTKISFVFLPIVSFLGIIMLPLVMSALIYYLLLPFVTFLEKKGLSRTWAITVVFVAIVAFLIWAISAILPMIQMQLLSFIENLPSYISTVSKQVNKYLSSPLLQNYHSQLQNLLNSISTKAVGYAETFSKGALNWVGNFAGTIAKVIVAVIISPFIIFYFLRDGKQMKEGFLSVLPTKSRQPISRMLTDINSQLAGYVQGQVTVAVIVGIIFAILFSFVGLRYALTFSIMAGILNMVPYLGSFLAMLPVLVMAFVQDPIMLVKVIFIFIIEQTIEGRFVSPLVMSSKLSIHPITIMFILLTAGSMFGVWGVFLGIPAYASIRVVVKEIFDWYKKVSGLYQDDYELIGEVDDNDE